MRIHFGIPPASTADRASTLDTIKVCIPTLGAQTTETLPLENPTHQTVGLFDIWEDAHFTFGIAKVKVETSTDAQTFEHLYSQLFQASKGAYLYRVWSYLPDLNQGTGDSERYKQFCEGRSIAFNKAFGADDSAYIPAGTCVGCEGDEIVLYFLAGKQIPDHHENPQQVPAYRYPRQYGPKSPSFARATSVHIDRKHYQFISGTAAVTGHASQGLNDLNEQLKITCDNLDIITRQIREDTQGTTCDIHSGKVYLRHANDFKATRDYLKTRFPEIADTLIYLKSDICRKELLVEIEFSL